MTSPKRSRQTHQLSLEDTPPATDAPPANDAQPPAKAHAAKNGSTPRRGKGSAPAEPIRRSAHDLAKRQREISVSEFFAKNRHLLGFDNAKKALLTTIKEAVDNSLDACEEARILPDVRIEIVELAEGRYRIVVEDNGPGIVRAQVPKIFGQLLYGSKFHSRRQSRGQQGIGISAAGMYGQLTTGKPMIVTSRTGPRAAAHKLVVQIDTGRNVPTVVSDEEAEFPHPHGTRVEIELEGLYQKGRRSVDGYVEATALANPHARFAYVAPGSAEIVYERLTGELPPEPKEIKPHPHGVELGMLIKMIEETRARTIALFLQTEFSRVSARLAEEILASAKLPVKLTPGRTKREAAEALYQAIQKAKIMAPPTDCLSPIGATALEAGLRAQVKADFYTAVTRSPCVYRGNPFQVEVALAYGGELPGDELTELHRFANRVPLLYQQSACASTKAAIATDWRNYALSQSKGALPTGPLVLMLHIASVWVPFTSESKEAIAHYPEILKELRLALQDCGRRLGAYLKRRRRDADDARKRAYIERYIPHVGIALREILGLSAKDEALVVSTLTDTLERSRTNDT